MISRTERGDRDIAAWRDESERTSWASGRKPKLKEVASGSREVDSDRTRGQDPPVLHAFSSFSLLSHDYSCVAL